MDLLDYVDFVVHVFLRERRAFYDIERLRKSARPLTPAEFDEELKAALAEKTRAARKKAPAARELSQGSCKIRSRDQNGEEAPCSKESAAPEGKASKKPERKK